MTPQEKSKKKHSYLKGCLITILVLFGAFIILCIVNPAPKDYKKSKEEENSDKGNMEKTEVGDTITFGAYEQDYDTSNGKENIEWRILDKEDDKILVISEKALDCQKYDETLYPKTWDTCSLRSWLNDDFLKEAFSSDEQEKIPTVTVTADKNPEWDTNPGGNTEDQVFLLSCVEAEKYFNTDEDRQCIPTAYAIANGANQSAINKSSEGNGYCDWWLRSPGYRGNFAADVPGSGIVTRQTVAINLDTVCVRPAMWITTE